MTHGVGLSRGARRFARGALVAALVVAPLAALDGACGSENAAPEACPPGRALACVGKGGCNGGQACNEAGTGFGECVCPGAGETDSGSKKSPPKHPDGGRHEDASPEAHVEDAPADAGAKDAPGDSRSKDAPTDSHPKDAPADSVEPGDATASSDG
jgi:hypothetical protein